MTRKRFVFDLNRCTGCQACRIGCLVENGIDGARGWRKILTFNERRLSHVPLYHLSLACNHCEEPACVTLCPTGALDFEDRGEERVDAGPVAGFPDTNIGPSIRFTPLREGHAVPECSTFAGPHATEPLSSAERTPEKISLRSEWPLLLFTYLAMMLVSLCAASTIRPIAIDPATFIVVGLAAMASSATHLGKKTRAWRAVLNVRTSWVSREVFFYGLFLALAAASLFLLPEGRALRAAAALAGLALLYVIDRVYRVPGLSRPAGPHIHSGDALPAGLFLAALFAGLYLLAVPIALIRVALYFRRKRAIKLGGGEDRPFLGFLRVIVGLVVPGLIAIGGPGGVPLALAAVLLGEAVDRIEFYLELEPITPRRALDAALRDLLARPPGRDTIRLVS